MNELSVSFQENRPLFLSWYIRGFDLFFHTTSIPREVEPAGLAGLRGPTLVHSPNWSMADRLFYLRGWEGGNTDRDTAEASVHTQNIRVKANESLRVERSRNQEQALHLLPANYSVEKACILPKRGCSSHLPSSSDLAAILLDKNLFHFVNHSPRLKTLKEISENPFFE